jgi:hypothetical protein
LRKAAASVLFLAAVATSPAGAQDQQVDVPQISASSSLAPPAEPVAQRTAQALQQLSSGDDSRPAERQVTAAGSSNEQPSQVATRTRNAQPPQPLSTPQQGRTAAVDPVHGHDRCDPADSKQSKTLQCRKVIENRAAEYTRPSPTRLSPEQKLLIDQQLLASEASLAGATHRLATSGNVDQSLETMGIASVVLDQSSKPKDPEKKEDDPKSDAAVQAILTILNQPPPQ